jgi:hypothetical protein
MPPRRGAAAGGASRDVVPSRRRWSFRSPLRGRTGFRYDNDARAGIFRMHRLCQACGGVKLSLPEDYRSATAPRPDLDP